VLLQGGAGDAVPTNAPIPSGSLRDEAVVCVGVVPPIAVVRLRAGLNVRLNGAGSPEASIVAARPVVREGAGGRPHGGVRRVHRRDRHVGASHGGVEGVEGG